MKAYFENPERVAALKASVQGWIGTPFHRYAALKGVGVDCVHLVAEVYADAGVISRPFHLPRYTMDAGHHLDRSMLLEFVDSTGRFADVHLSAALPLQGCKGCGEVPVQPNLPALLPGDLLGLKIGRVIHHAGIYLGGEQAEFVHAIQGYGVILNTLRDSTWLTRLAAIRRPME